jgi:hypothetical protein
VSYRVALQVARHPARTEIVGARGLCQLTRLTLFTAFILGACGAQKSPSESFNPGDSQFGTDFSVLEHHNGPGRTGVYVHPSFTRHAAAGIHLDFSTPVEGVVNAQPLFLDGQGSEADMVLVVTEANQVFAIDASTGILIWRRRLDPPAPRQLVVDALGDCGGIDPIGITGTPVIDGHTRRIYFDLVTPDDARYDRHLVYALSLQDGSTVPGWPVDVATSVSGFRDVVQNQRGALALLNGRVYVPYGGHSGDCADYRGWLVGISTSDPASVAAWRTGVIGAGIWASSGVASDGTSLFVATGNGAETEEWMGSEAIIRLGDGPTFTGLPADYFAPLDWPKLDLEDADLGGSGVIVFDVPGANPSGLVAALGKDGKMYLADRSNLGGIGGGILAEVVSSEGVITAPSAYSTAQGTYVTFNGFGQGISCPDAENIFTIKIEPTSPLSISTAWCASAPGFGSTIVTTTDGTSESIVWVVGAKGDNRLYGFDGDTGAVIALTDDASEVTHLTAPIAAKGRIYVGATDQLYAFTLN